MTQTFEPAAHARVDAHRARLQDEASDQVRIHAALRLDLAAGRLFDLLEQRSRLIVRKLVRGRQLDVQAALLARHEPVELACDLLDLTKAALLGGEPQEVADELVSIAEQLVQHVYLRARPELRIAQKRA